MFLLRSRSIWGLGFLLLAVPLPLVGQVVQLPGRQRLPLVMRQVADFIVQEPAAAPGAEAAASEDSSPTVVVETATPGRPPRPNELRFHLWDGNVISGELSIAELTVRTDFGTLTIPVGKIQTIRPGLDSFPDRQARIAELVETLGAPDFAQREAARRELIGMGRLLHLEIHRVDDGGNGERKRQLEEIRKEFEQQVEDRAEDEELSDLVQPLIRKDQINTGDFTVVGKIEPTSFQVASKYGPLTVQLADVRFADREQTGSLIRRATVTVAGNNFASTSLKSTGIRVERGDVVSVRASGSISMTPWGQQAMATPDGNPGYGNFEGHGGGTLLGRIGDNGDYIKLGSKANFIARKAGVLELGVAVQAEYAQQGYQFPGEFKVKVVVESKATE